MDGVYLLYDTSIDCLSSGRYVYLAYLCSICGSSRKYGHPKSSAIRTAVKSILICSECRICSFTFDDVHDRADHAIVFHPIDDDGTWCTARVSSIWCRCWSRYLCGVYSSRYYLIMCDVVGIRFEILQNTQQTVFGWVNS